MVLRRLTDIGHAFLLLGLLGNVVIVNHQDAVR
jgi:hypothetical protein